MAISKTISANGSKGHHYFSLNVTESYTSGNSSYMSGSFSLGPLQAGWDWNNWGDRISYSFNIGSNQFTGSIPRYDGSSVLYLQTFNNVEIPHESNGKKTIDISFSVTDTTGANYTSGNASARDTMTLTELHKAPEITQFEITEGDQTLVSRGITNQLVNRASNKIIEIQQQFITLYDNATISKIEVFGENFKFEFTGDQTFLPCNFYNIDFIYHETTAYGDEYKYAVLLGVRITDSLGGVGEVAFNYPFIYYQPPNIVETQSSVKRNGQLTGKANLNLLANFTNSKIGNAQNTISSFMLKYWEINTTEPDAYTIEIPSSAYTIDNNTISIYNWGISNNGVEITNLDKSKAYYFKIVLRDSINNSYDITLLCSKGVWLMAKFKDRVDFQKITINGSNPFEYSETETIIGKWIDGKPLYQKVLRITSVVNSDNTDFAHNIENVDLIFIKKAFINQVSSGEYDGWSWSLPVTLYQSNTEEDKLTIAVSRWGVRFYVQTEWGTSWIKYVVLNYTKTTDEGGL